MTATKHTPGPWHVDSSDDVYVQIPHPSAEGGSYAIRCIPELCESADSQDYANARLIAAAPELLAALAECHSLLACTKHKGWEGDAAQKQARIAIAKARGEA